MQASLHSTSTIEPPASAKTSRRSGTRDKKLKVISFYKENNLYRTSKHFNINTTSVLRWVKDEVKIKESKWGSRLFAKIDFPHC